MRRSYKLGLIVLALLGIVAFTVPSKKNPDKKQDFSSTNAKIESWWNITQKENRY